MNSRQCLTLYQTTKFYTCQNLNKFRDNKINVTGKFKVNKSLDQ